MSRSISPYTSSSRLLSPNTATPNYDEILTTLNTLKEQFEQEETHRNKKMMLTIYNQLLAYINSQPITAREKNLTTHQKWAAISTKSFEIFGGSSGVIAGAWGGLALDGIVPAMSLTAAATAATIATITLTIAAPLLFTTAYIVYKGNEDTVKDERAMMFKQTLETARGKTLEQKRRLVRPLEPTPIRSPRNMSEKSKANKLFNSTLYGGLAVSGSIFSISVLLLGLAAVLSGPVGWAAVSGISLIGGIGYRFYTQHKIDMLANQKREAIELEHHNDELERTMPSLENPREKIEIKGNLSSNHSFATVSDSTNAHSESSTTSSEAKDESITLSPRNSP